MARNPISRRDLPFFKELDRLLLSTRFRRSGGDIGLVPVRYADQGIRINSPHARSGARGTPRRDPYAVLELPFNNQTMRTLHGFAGNGTAVR